MTNNSNLGSSLWSLNRHFDPFSLFLDVPTKTALILNPKVMSSFTKNFLTDGFREFKGKDDPSDHRYGLLRNARSFPVAPVSAYWRFATRPDFFESFAFVRNPYARTLSAWRDKLLDGHNATVDGRDSGYARSMRNGELRRIRKFAINKKLAGAGEGELVPFTTFVEFILSKREGCRNHHWDTQTSVLQMQHARNMQVFKFEDEMSMGFTLVMSRLGFDRDWVVKRLSRPVNPSSKAKTTFYNPEVAAKAFQANHTDFVNFRYDPSSFSGM